MSEKKEHHLPSCRVDQDTIDSSGRIKLYLHKTLNDNKGRMPSTADAIRFALSYTDKDIQGLLDD